MITQPKTAAEAVEAWRQYDKYLEDDGASPGYFQEMFGAAKQAVELASAGKVPIEQLVPDDTERSRLVANAEECDIMREREERAYAEMDPPPEDDGLRRQRDIEDDEAWPFLA